VDLSPGTCAQYQKSQAKKWLSETCPKEKENESHCVDDYFDTSEDFTVETGENFFDFEPSTNLCDVLDMDSIAQA
jgi:hypothetical protein